MGICKLERMILSLARGGALAVLAAVCGPITATAQEQQGTRSPLGFRTGGANFSPAGFIDNRDTSCVSRYGPGFRYQGGACIKIANGKTIYGGPLPSAEWGDFVQRSTRELLLRSSHVEALATVGVEGGILGSNADFDVIPPFNVSGASGVVGVNGGVMFNWTGIYIGPRVGALFGFGSNSISEPPASPFFTYSVEHPWTIYQEIVFGGPVKNPFWPTMPVRRQDYGPFDGPISKDKMFFFGGVGFAEVHTLVFGTTTGLSVESSHTAAGFTASVGLGVPITGSALVTGQFRYINVPSATFFIPGPVQISGNEFIGSLGVTFAMPVQ